MMENKVIPIRLSHSSLSTLHECERKWQIAKLLAGPPVREESEHFSFGHSFGVGVATYLVTQDTDKALFAAWLAYFPEIETDKKNIPLAVIALLSAFKELDTLLMDYEVASFAGKPAVELSFRIDINESFYFVGHIDVILKHRFSGKFFVIDAKSTGLTLFDLSPLYQYSGQTVGYSIALDRIVGAELSEFGVGYVVAQLNARSYTSKTHILIFEKTLLDRLKWFMNLGMDVKRLETMAELGHYPQRAESCLRFNRPCPHFNNCHLTSLDVPVKREEDPIKYDFIYDLDELIQDHLRRIPAASGVSKMEKV